MRNTFPSNDKAYAWDTIRDNLDSREWNVSGQLIEKDGYEVYVTNEGFELAMRDPETREDVVLFQALHLDVASPHFAAAVLSVLNNVEEIAQQSDKI